MATSVPTEVVVAGMQGFEDAYNADNTAFCGACYTDKCHVTVNGGTEAGGFGPFTTPAEVAAFLNTLRNELGGTNIKFTVTNVDALKHDDTWTADNGTGACAAEWVQVDGNWKIEKDAISFTPKVIMSSDSTAAAEHECLSCAKWEAEHNDLKQKYKNLAYLESVQHKSMAAMEHSIPDNLMVDRSVAEVDEATMKTDGIVGHIKPGQVYRVTDRLLEKVSDEERQNTGPLELPEPTTPPMLVIENGFQDNASADFGESSSNILGGNTLFITKDPSYIIPRALESPSNYAYYGAHLVKIGSKLMFETPQIVPVTIMTVGKRYIESYLLNADRGGGFYFEYHDCPHYHQPISPESGGWLLLGKFTESKNHIRISGFKIPPGHGVYMPPGVLHCDAYLRGEYLVAYTAAKHFKTGLFRTADMQLTKVRVWCENTQNMWSLGHEDSGHYVEKRAFFKMEPEPAQAAE